MLGLVKNVEERGFHLLAGVRLSCCCGGGSSRWMSSNTVMSFGDGSQGALGLPTLLMGSDSYEPTPVPGLPSDVSSLAAGHYHSLAVTSQGHLWAWGRNNESQLARPLLSPRSSLSLHLSVIYLYIYKYIMVSHLPFFFVCVCVVISFNN